MPSTPIIDLHELVSQAGQATYQKGVLLFKANKVSQNNPEAGIAL